MASPTSRKKAPSKKAAAKNKARANTSGNPARRDRGIPKSVDDQLWENWKASVRHMRVTGVDINSKPGVTVFTAMTDEHHAWQLSLRRKRRYVVGIDVVDYSRRSDEGRLYLTTIIFASIESALALLTSVGWTSSVPSDQVLPTGDGAFVLFDTWHEAFAFIMCLQMFIEDVNRGPDAGVDRSFAGDEFPYLPCEVRYALAVGNAYTVASPRGRDFVGSSLVTAARILGASSGAHLLVDDEVMSEIIEYGGINEVGRYFEECAWNQRFHLARMPSAQVKAQTVHFWNVFGLYDVIALQTRVAKHREARFPVDSRTYAVGSHNVGALKA